MIGIDPGLDGVQWNTGATEDGSSGAPLFNSNGDVVGQLDSGFHGPGSSCDSPSEPDEFGRLDVTFASIQKWLQGGNGGGTPAGVGVNGTYNGLVYDPDTGISPQTAGLFTVKSTSKGKLSGKLVLGPNKYSFSGAFDSTGAAEISVRSQFNRLTLAFWPIDPNNPSGMTGSVTDGNFTSQLTGDLAVYDGRSRWRCKRANTL